MKHPFPPLFSSVSLTKRDFASLTKRELCLFDQERTLPEGWPSPQVMSMKRREGKEGRKRSGRKDGIYRRQESGRSLKPSPRSPLSLEATTRSSGCSLNVENRDHVPIFLIGRLFIFLISSSGFSLEASLASPWGVEVVGLPAVVSPSPWLWKVLEAITPHQHRVRWLSPPTRWSLIKLPQALVMVYHMFR